MTAPEPNPTAATSDWTRGYNAGHDELRDAVMGELYGPGLSPMVDARIRSALADGDVVEGRVVPTPTAAATGLTKVRGEHYPTTPVQCACGWRETDPDAGTWTAHLAARLSDPDVVEAAAALERVKALHHRRKHTAHGGSSLGRFDFVGHGQTEFPDQCDHCRRDWPCDTARALGVA